MKSWQTSPSQQNVEEVGIVVRMIRVVVGQLGNVEMFGMVRAFRRKAAGQFAECHSRNQPEWPARGMRVSVSRVRASISRGIPGLQVAGLYLLPIPPTSFS